MLYKRNSLGNIIQDITEYNNQYAALKLAEILHLLNYSMNFYVYCASGSVFRNQLKYSSKQF